MGIAEVLDRSIDLCLRRFPTLAAILAVYQLPVLALTVQNGHDVSVYSELAERLGLIATAHGAHARPTYEFVVAFVLEFVLGPLVGVAVFISISSFYLEKRSSIAEAYRATGPIAVAILWINVFYEIPTFVVFLANDEVTRRLNANPQQFDLLFVIFGGFFVLSSLGFVGSLNSCAVAFERGAIGSSIWKTLRRVGAPNRLARSFGSLIVVGFVWIVTIAIHDAIWSLLPKYHVTSTFVVAAIASIVEMVEAIFISAFTVIFYYDVRAREEAFDLHVAIDAIERHAASPATT